MSCIEGCCRIEHESISWITLLSMASAISKTLMVWALGGLQDLDCVKSSDPRWVSDLQVGGTPAVLKYLLKQGLIDGSCLTVTGTHMPLSSFLHKMADMSSSYSLPVACFSDGQDNLGDCGVLSTSNMEGLVSSLPYHGGAHALARRRHLSFCIKT